MMTNLFALIGPPSKIIPRGSRVLIKVNLTSEDNLWERGILTSPLFSRAPAEEVQKARPAEVIIAEGAAVGQDTKKGLRRQRLPGGGQGYRDPALRPSTDGEHEEVKTSAGGNLEDLE